MSLLKTFRTLDDKFSWSFLGFVIGLMGTTYAIYVDQFKEQKPLLVFDVLSNTQVLSVKEDLNKLDIFYDRQNLKVRNENLILLTLKISNEGTENIRKNDYYSLAPFGFKLVGCNIAEPPIVIDASNDFIKENVSVLYDSLNRITFNKIPFNKRQYFILKVLTICGNNNYPEINPFGNISGINKSFYVRQSYLESQRDELSFIEKLVHGNLGIHIVRFLIYLFLLITSLLLIGIPTSKILRVIELKRRKRLIKRFREKSKVNLSKNIEIIFELFLDVGTNQIKWFNQLINDKEKLTKYNRISKNNWTEFSVFINNTKDRSIEDTII